jgi:hypothetical protein
MKKITDYVLAYAMWIIDILLGIWLVLISRTAILGIFALSYKEGKLQYAHMVDFIDKAISLAFGLGWLAFVIVSEEYLRAGIPKKNLIRRFARLTGPELLIIFVVDLILVWLGGIASSDLLRWLILAAELGFGIMLYTYAKNTLPSKPR